MTGSQSITKIAVALLKAQRKMGDATKQSINPFFKSNYADLNTIRETVIPVLNEEGISVLQPTITLGEKNFVETVLLHESGEWIAGITQIINEKGKAQDEGSGISYARRYGLQSICNVGAVDDDGEVAQGRKNQVQQIKEQPLEVPKNSKESTGVVTLSSNSKELITSAFKVLEAQGKITKETFKTNYLQGKGISTVTPNELPNIYQKMLKDFPHLNAKGA